MDRRSFTEHITVTMGGVLGVGHLGRRVFQETGAQYTFLDEAVAHSDAVTAFTRGTTTSSEAALLSDELFNAVSYGIQGDFDSAFDSLRSVEAATDRIAGAVVEIANSRGVPQFREAFVRAPAMFIQGMQRWSETGDWIVLRVSLSRLRCILSCLVEHRACFGPVGTKVLGCGIKALPGLWLEGPGYLAFFAACMLEASPDLAVNFFIECLPNLGPCVGGCIG